MIVDVARTKSEKGGRRRNRRKSTNAWRVLIAGGGGGNLSEDLGSASDDKIVEVSKSFGDLRRDKTRSVSLDITD